jgi:phosphocarrier protein FPr/phosphocarrier protein
VAYLPAPREDNPALGLRGVRLSLARPALLDAQIRAALRVRPIGVCRIMAPMIASLEELRAVREALDRARAAFGVTAPVALGVMIETPAAAMIAADLAAEADFLSIGTNDLTQYALAMDRTNPAVASGIDALHPAVVRLIALTCEGAARAGKGVGVCGGLASEALAAPLLIGLGVTELSVRPHQAPDIKHLIRGLTLEGCQNLARRALSLSSPIEVRALSLEGAPP